MIQRIQSLYLLVSSLILFVVFYLPLGYVNSEVPAKFSICGLFDSGNGELIRANLELASVLFITIALQFVTIFLFKKRRIQALLAQICLILILLVAVASLMFGDLFSLDQLLNGSDLRINYNWNIILIAISWVLTFLALRAIRKDEALVQSTERMR